MSEPKPPVATSHAHNVDPIKDGKIGESSKNLSDQFAKAKALQLEKQAAAKQPSSQMSHARTVQMDGKETKLDGASRNMRSQFDRAKAAQAARPQNAKSEMKAPAPAPQMHLRPGGALQRAVDKPIQDKQMSDYSAHVKQLSQSIKARSANQNQAELKNERGKDNDRGR